MEKSLTDFCNEKIFESEILRVTFTDFWDFEDDNGVSISGPYGIDIDIKGFNSPKNPKLRNINCLSKSFNDYDKALAYAYIRLKSFKKGLEEELDYFKDILVEEKYKGIKECTDNKEFIYTFTKWGTCTKATICNFHKYEDELNCKFTPLVTIDGSNFRSNGNKDYSNKEKSRLKGVTDWFFLMKNYTNNCEQALRDLVNFLSDAIEDISPVFEWIVNLYNKGLDTGVNQGKVLSFKQDQYSYNKKPQPIEQESFYIQKKDEWSDESTSYSNENWEDEDIPF